MALASAVIILTLAVVPRVAGQNGSNSVVSIPYEYTYLLPDAFNGNVNYTFVNGTSTGNSSIDSLLRSAAQAPFIAYDQAFLDILGPNPTADLVLDRTASGDQFAYEAGVWVPERNEVWFTSSVQQGAHIPGRIQALNLSTGSIANLNTTPSIHDPNGAYYFEGKIYFASYPDNGTYRGGILSIDAITLEWEWVLNSYFGLPFNGVDDIAWAVQGNDRYMYFTDLAYPYLAYPTGLPPLQMPANVWRWDNQTKVLLPVISRNDINPNGVRVSPDMRTLYVTDSSSLGDTGTGAASWLGPYIYAWDLDTHMMPVNRRLFGMVRQGIADGIHIDDAGNVWTGESEGVVVRNPQGKTIGVFNAQYFQADKSVSGLAIANFAIAGDTLVFLSTTRLWTVKLGRTVVGRNSVIVN